MASHHHTRVQKIMVQPINLIFRFLQHRTRVQIWLYEQIDLRLEGRIMGFDEFMNIVLDDAVEISLKKKAKAEDEGEDVEMSGGRKKLGRILLKGENITLIQAA